MILYNKRKYMIAKMEFEGTLKALKTDCIDCTYICINSLLSKAEQSKVLHDVLKGRKLKAVVER